MEVVSETIKVVLEGADDKAEDRASIMNLRTNEKIVFENRHAPTVSVYEHDGSHSKYVLSTIPAFERLFRTLYESIDPHDNLNDLKLSGEPRLKGHYDAMSCDYKDSSYHKKTNVTLYCYSSMSFTTRDGSPYLHLSGAKLHHVRHRLDEPFFHIMKEAIQTELKRT